MTRRLRIAMLANVSRRYDRRAACGVASYAREHEHWSLYIEEDPFLKLPPLEDWDGDGIIANFDEHRVALAVSGLKIPVVGIGSGRGWYDPRSRIPYFTTDNAAIGRLAAEHFFDCGFSRLAFFGHSSNRRYAWSEEREQAFIQRARAGGAACAVFHDKSLGVEHWVRQFDELAGWLENLEKPVGVFACTDIRGRQILETCRMMGIHVPDAVAVIGVDNDEMICELTSPRLSSIEQGSLRMGYEAAALLDRLIVRGRPKKLRHVISPEGLVARESTDVLACPDTDLAAAIRFVRRHACDPIGVADVLDAVPLSRSTLEKRFLVALGRTIHAEIHRVQMEQAKRLLSHTTLLVKQIARRCGFRYVSAFNRVFCQHTGLTPARYRRAKAASGAFPY